MKRNVNKKEPRRHVLGCPPPIILRWRQGMVVERGEIRGKGDGRREAQKVVGTAPTPAEHVRPSRLSLAAGGQSGRMASVQPLNQLRFNFGSFCPRSLARSPVLPGRKGG